MVGNAGIFNGVVRGGAIEIEGAHTLKDGDRVTVLVRPADDRALPPGEGLRRAFGAWADEADAVDEFLRQNREQRRQPRRELAP